VCSVCQRIARGTWSAQVVFEPEGSTHLVGAVRDQWLKAATRTGLEGARRVLRIRAADRMNEQAQNAFLKVLEEPPPAVLWMLEVVDDTQLLDTIHSRVRRVDLAPWRPDDLVTWAATQPDVPLDREAAEAIARVAAGSPERLRDLASPARTKARDANLDVLRRLVEEGAHVVDELARDVLSHGKAAAKERKLAHTAELDGLPDRYGVEKASEIPKGVVTALKDRHKRELRLVRDGVVDLFLDDLGSWLRDLIVLVGRGGANSIDGSHGLDGIVNRDRVEALRRDADRFQLPDLLEAVGAVERCRLSLERNGNAELQVSRLLLSLAGPAWEAARV
jgi:DNA polymerase-3 subunit delta'